MSIIDFLFFLLIMILDFIGDLLLLGYGKESESQDVVEANILSVVLATIL